MFITESNLVSTRNKVTENPAILLKYADRSSLGWAMFGTKPRVNKDWLEGCTQALSQCHYAPQQATMFEH